jgi:twinfilin-like protein
MEEQEKQEIRKAETGVEIGASTKRQIATGVSFPIVQEAQDELLALKAGKRTYVQLSLNLSAENIELVQAGNQSIDDIHALIPADSARYHVFNFKHNHEGDSLESIVFVYSCPGYQCSVKERMMYSTCKGPLIDQLENQIKITLTKKLEIGEASEFTQEWLYEQLHPTQVVFKQKFKRPTRPGKGNRRMIQGGSGSEQTSDGDD